MIPLLSRPSFLSFKNRIVHSPQPYIESSRYIFILLLGILISTGSFIATKHTLYALEQYSNLYFISPTKLLELLFFFLFSLLVITSGISFISVFFLSKDLDLLRASPIRPHKFILGKFTELLSLSSWILIFFGLPIFIAYGSYYSHPVFFYSSIFFILPLFLLLATGIGALAVFLISLLVPAEKVREYTLLSSLLLLTGGYIWFRSSQIELDEASALSDLVRYSLLSSNTLNSWFPSTWIAELSSELLHGPSEKLGPSLPLLLGSTGLTLSTLYCGLRFNYESSYSSPPLTKNTHGIYGKFLSPLKSFILQFLPQDYRAFFVKDLRLFLRDITQGVQLVLLLSLCLVYLYNFQNFSFTYTMPPEWAFLMETFLSLMNIFMGSFVLIAISARFAFPSISLEGKSQWIIKSSSLSIQRYLRAKLVFWIILFLPLTLVIYLAGALALQLSPLLILSNITIGSSLCLLYLSMGILFGVKYVNYQWDHPAQLTASFGNFYFMTLAMILSFLSLLPITLLVGLTSYLTYIDQVISIKNIFILFVTHYFFIRVIFKISLTFMNAAKVRLKND